MFNQNFLTLVTDVCHIFDSHLEQSQRNAELNAMKKEFAGKIGLRRLEQADSLSSLCSLLIQHMEVVEDDVHRFYNLMEKNCRDSEAKIEILEMIKDYQSKVKQQHQVPRLTHEQEPPVRNEEVRVSQSRQHNRDELGHFYHFVSCLFDKSPFQAHREAGIPVGPFLQQCKTILFLLYFPSFAK